MPYRLGKLVGLHVFILIHLNIWLRKDKFSGQHFKKTSRTLSHKLCNETGHPIVNLMETEDKNMIRMSQWRESHYRTNTTVKK